MVKQIFLKNNENVYKIQKLASKKVNFNSPLYAWMIG